jgi:hypothetical protein
VRSALNTPCVPTWRMKSSYWERMGCVMGKEGRMQVKKQGLDGKNQSDLIMPGAPSPDS